MSEGRAALATRSSDLAIEDLTIFEKLMMLHDSGWEWRPLPSSMQQRCRLPLYMCDDPLGLEAGEASEKVFYTGFNICPHYLHALLEPGRLLAHGIVALPHGCSFKQYEDLVTRGIAVRSRTANPMLQDVASDRARLALQGARPKKRRRRQGRQEGEGDVEQVDSTGADAPELGVASPDVCLEEAGAECERDDLDEHNVPDLPAQITAPTEGILNMLEELDADDEGNSLEAALSQLMGDETQHFAGGRGLEQGLPSPLLEGSSGAASSSGMDGAAGAASGQAELSAEAEMSRIRHGQMWGPFRFIWKFTASSRSIQATCPFHRGTHTAPLCRRTLTVREGKADETLLRLKAWCLAYSLFNRKCTHLAYCPPHTDELDVEVVERAVRLADPLPDKHTIIPDSVLDECEARPKSKRAGPGKQAKKTNAKDTSAATSRMAAATSSAGRASSAQPARNSMAQRGGASGKSGLDSSAVLCAAVPSQANSSSSSSRSSTSSCSSRGSSDPSSSE